MGKVEIEDRMGTATQTISALIVDKREIFRQLIAACLEGTPHVDVVGFAATGEAAIEQAAKLSPDLIIMDMRLSGINGVTAVRYIKRYPKAPRVILTSLYDNLCNRMAAQEAGVDAFVPKSDFSSALLPAVYALFPMTDGPR